METEQKTFTKEEYEHHGEWMFDHGKCVAYQDILKTEVTWCVSMVDRNWDLDTVIIGDGSLRNIRFVNSILTDEKDVDGDYIPEYIYTTAKDATVNKKSGDDDGGEESTLRHINVVKNKLSGWHGRIVCDLDYKTARYTA